MDAEAGAVSWIVSADRHHLFAVKNITINGAKTIDDDI